MAAQTRVLTPADLFRFERVGAIAWTSDRTAAAIEIHRPGSWIDQAIPTAAIHVLDVGAARLRVVSPSMPDVLGFFGPAWSADGRRLAFLFSTQFNHPQLFAALGYGVVLFRFSRAKSSLRRCTAKGAAPNSSYAGEGHTIAARENVIDLLKRIDVWLRETLK